MVAKRAVFAGLLASVVCRSRITDVLSWEMKSMRPNGPTPARARLPFSGFSRLRTPSMLKSSSRESLSLGMAIPVGGVHQRSGIVKAAGPCGRSLSCVDAPGDANSKLQRTQNRIRRVPDQQRVAGLRRAKAVTSAGPAQESRRQTGADRCLGAPVALPCALGDELTGLDQ